MGRQVVRPNRILTHRKWLTAGRVIYCGCKAHGNIFLEILFGGAGVAVRLIMLMHEPPLDLTSFGGWTTNNKHSWSRRGEMVFGAATGESDD